MLESARYFLNFLRFRFAVVALGILDIAVDGSVIRGCLIVSRVVRIALVGLLSFGRGRGIRRVYV